jgi:hypothetical protein
LLGGGQGRAADEDAEPPEESLLGGGEQVIAPGNRPAHGLLPRREIARAGGE